MDRAKPHQSEDQEKYLEYAIDLLNLGTQDQKSEAKRSIRSFKYLYYVKEIYIDFSFTGDKLHRLANSLADCVNTIESLHPFILHELLQISEDYGEWLLPDKPYPDPDCHPGVQQLRENLTDPLRELAFRCLSIVEWQAFKVGAPIKVRDYTLVYFTLVLFAELKPGEARPYAGRFPLFARAVFTYVTGDGDNELRRQINAAFKDLRREHPDLLPKHLRTARKQKSQKAVRPRK